ncbi:uncharacterized protein LOC125496528 [Beta vulgaris subsp. vulgaris]|uniref:uncharacterized protein LOC125496528 n=1 Tax=Beta vulgaris subsp. vulgaris TaxID=3555 RepID=UPI002036EEBE|nr:uncharacterized protein LOC125496528 [Beta vulgaris subsp. vulgaris]
MLNRFSNIVNELESLGKYISSEEQVRKILRSLPKEKRTAKVTALQETKDFTKFNLERLAGSLLTHELQLGTQYGESSKNRALALKDDKEEEEDEDFNVEEIMKLVRKFKRMYKNLKSNKTKGKNSFNSKFESGFYKCGSLDHYIKECPSWKQESKLEEEFWDNGTAQLCLMTKFDFKSKTELSINKSNVCSRKELKKMWVPNSNN